MLDKEFTGMISSVSAKSKTVKAEDGTKMKLDVLKVKLESADIDYESIAEFNPSISSTLLNLQPMPFRAVNFGDQSLYAMMLTIKLNEEMENPVEERYGHVTIPNLTINVRDNIPVFSFTLEIPTIYNSDFVLKLIKQKISFSFSKMEQR